MNLKITKINFLTFVSYSLCVLLTIILSGCDGIVRQKTLTLLPTHHSSMRMERHDNLDDNIKVGLEVKSIEALKNNKLVVLEKDGAITSYTNITWLRPVSRLVDEAFRDCWSKTTGGKTLLSKHSKSQIKIMLFITDCHYSKVRESKSLEEMYMNIKVSFETSSGIKHGTSFIKTCKVGELQATLLDLITDCVNYSIKYIYYKSEKTPL